MRKNEYFSSFGSNVLSDEEALDADVADHGDELSDDDDGAYSRVQNITTQSRSGTDHDNNKDFNGYYNMCSASSSPPESPSASLLSTTPKTSNSLMCTNNKAIAVNWPQSYRQAMDIYNIIGSPSLSSSLPNFPFRSRRLSQNSISNDKLYPLVDENVWTKEEKEETNLHKEMPSILKKYSSSKVIDDPHAIPPGCTFTQGTMNGINVLCGVGILTTPYALKQGGWISLGVLFFLAIASWYTGCLLRNCVDNQPGLNTYPDIGQAAFGITGRIIISVALYMEMYAGCVEYLILEGDNLSALFPNAGLTICGLKLTAAEIFMTITAISVLPTVWLRDFRLLAYIAAGGVTATVILVLCVFWIGTIDNLGFNRSGPLTNFSTLPVSIGLFGFCFSGHSLFPNIYRSLKKPEQFHGVLTVSFIFCTLMYSGIAIMGFTMFGDDTQSQITLNLPNQFVASKIALWSTVVNPFTKYAITMAPVAMGFEELLLPSIYTYKGYSYSLLIRTLLVLSTLFVAISVPFFAYLMALAGSVMSMLLCLIFPSACFLKLVGIGNKSSYARLQIVACVVIIITGVLCSVAGTYSSLLGIVDSLGSK